MGNVEGKLVLSKYDIVDTFDPHFVKLHSTAPVLQPQPKPAGFIDVLSSWPNQSLWEYFKCDGDGEWIRRGLIFGTIELVDDGLYMRIVDPKICSAAFSIRCTQTNMQASGTVVGQCNFSDNYCAEALGDMAGLLVLKAAT